jgi:hypothetical protein
MRNLIIALVVVVTMAAVSPTAFSQNPHDPTWKPCPQCTTRAQKEAGRAERMKLPLNPKDISGVWGDNSNRIQLDTKNIPPFTPMGQKLWEATASETSETGDPISNSKDPMLMCDPLGWPRWMTYNYGFEFLQLPDKTLQFFERGHTWRTIYTDGRSLPKDPDPRTLGYSVGRWEGNTFVVESYGFDDRTWLSEDRRDREHGFNHTTNLRTTERWTRLDPITLEIQLTITDPEIFTAPWVTTGKFFLNHNTEIWEDFCYPSEELWYLENIIKPASGVSKSE